MKLTRKLEAEALKVHKAYWDAYLNGDMKTFASMLDDDIVFFGTTVSEVFTNKKETLKFYKATADQLVGKAQFRNRKINIKEVDKNVLVNEQSDLYFLMGKKWAFYGHVRASAIFRQTITGWKLIHQHASFPDTRAEEGEQIAAEKIKAENIQLRDAVKRRTIELEEKNRELEIESALEKVRAQALGMRNADELLNICKVLFKELIGLGFTRLRNAIIHNFKDDKGYFTDYDYSDLTGGAITEISYHSNPIVKKFLKQIRKSDNAFVQITVKGNELKEWKQFRKKGGQPDDPRLNKASAIHYYCYSIHNASIGISTFDVINEEKLQLLKRFRNVFDFAYRRYMDIAQAEAQAREAQIQLALERVRARTMAMHHSDELTEVVKLLYHEFDKLKISNESTDIEIGLIDEETGIAKVWAHLYLSDGTISTFSFPFAHFDQINHEFEIWKSTPREKRNELFITTEFSGDLWEKFKVLARDIPELTEMFESLISANIQKWVTHNAYFSEGLLTLQGTEHYSFETQDILKRFAIVFEQTYTRFLDLKKAEAQTREAEIEVALERVRSKAMAMHKSEDLNAAVAVVFEELNKLDPGVLRCGISILDKEKRTGDVWVTSITDHGSAIQVSGDEAFDIHPLLQGAFDAWLHQEDFYYLLEGNDLTNYYKAVKAARFQLPASQFISSDFEHKKQHCYVAAYYAGGLFAFQETEFSEEAKKVMKRFAGVFDLTYKRFLDLQKAEANAREAKIEAALERVRGKAMAMHSSKDLANTIGVFYHELGGLSLTPRRCGVGLINKETRMAGISTMNASADGQGIELVGNLDLRSHPVLTGVYNNWLTQTEYHPVLSGNEIKEYYQLLRPQIDFPDYPNDTVQYGYFFFFEEGGVYAWTEKELTEEELKIYRRFTSVLSLTYKRYKDLRDAEARTRVAIKEAALDRIRANIASMRTINDLDRITPLIWDELTVLDIPFIRCGVFIMDEDQQLIHTFLSTPDGKAIAAFHLPYDTPGNIRHVISNWKVNKNYIDRWDETEFIRFAEILVQQGALASAGQYLKAIPQGRFYLHFLPFLQGMLYVGSTTQLSSDEIELIQHVANAFSTAYARYEDFNKLESAKQQVEKTLVDLKQAQQQLVQSEKMASLGELTAGIAHEIQNPLNFVNNFSEVSKELLDEMKEELATGNKQQAMEIAGDIIQNLEKINHHGKRADAIVKSMLQHSRTSSSQKEPTDINALADEYLRLAYHGLRAKDKSFNAKFETVFDESIEKIDVRPQDIGRVILNLINNAFYAVSEKKKSNTNGYEPTVTVSTKKMKNMVEVRVKDNGIGIPQRSLDKIFQPFFTTKPTGQGTGLGLSLAYDIVKAHSGEIKVNTKENEGTEFIIQIPAKEN